MTAQQQVLHTPERTTQDTTKIIRGTRRVTIPLRHFRPSFVNYHFLACNQAAFSTPGDVAGYLFSRVLRRAAQTLSSLSSTNCFVADAMTASLSEASPWRWILAANGMGTEKAFGVFLTVMLKAQKMRDLAATAAADEPFQALLTTELLIPKRPSARLARRS